MKSTAVYTEKEVAFGLPNLDKIVRGLMYVFIGSLPFHRFLFVERNSFIVLVLFIGLWCAVNRRCFHIGTPLDVPLLAFVLWVGVTIPFATYPAYSFREFGKLLQQVLMFYAVLYFFHDRAHLVRLRSMLLGLLFLVSLYGLIQYEETAHNGGSFLSAGVWLSTYLVMFIPLCAAQALYEEKTTMKLVYWAGTMLAVGCLLVGQSRAGVLALFCEMIALAWLSKRRLMQIIAGVFCVTLLGVILLLVKIDKTGEGNLVVSSRTAVPVKVDTNSVIHRFDIWVFFLKQIAERPILGIGYGKETSKMLFAEVPEVVLPGHHSVREHGTHNILMEIALHVGLPGLGLFLWVSARFAQTVFAYHRLAEDPQAKAILLGVAVSTVGVGVRVLFDQMLVSTLAIQFGVLAALAMASSVSDEGRLAVEGR